MSNERVANGKLGAGHTIVCVCAFERYSATNRATNSANSLLPWSCTGAGGSEFGAAEDPDAAASGSVVTADPPHAHGLSFSLANPTPQTVAVLGELRWHTKQHVFLGLLAEVGVRYLYGFGYMFSQQIPAHFFSTHLS